MNKNTNLVDDVLNATCTVSPLEYMEYQDGVRAVCDQHAELLEACKEFVKEFDEFIVQDEPGAHNPFRRVGMLAKEAIKKAEGV